MGGSHCLLRRFHPRVLFSNTTRDTYFLNRFVIGVWGPHGLSFVEPRSGPTFNGPQSYIWNMVYGEPLICFVTKSNPDDNLYLTMWVHLRNCFGDEQRHTFALSITS